MQPKKDNNTTLIQHSSDIMLGMCADIANGKLLTEADDETLHDMLILMYSDKQYYTARGITIGES